jgi:adenine deaminase
MKAMLRWAQPGTTSPKACGAITEGKSDPRHFILCTDDSHSQTLVDEGHVDRAIKQAISHGIPPITAIQMATLNTAEHFGLSRDIGMIAPGRYADILLVRGLVTIDPDLVRRGQLVEQRQLRSIARIFPIQMGDHSIHLPRKIEPSDFRIQVPGKSKVTANVIGIIENQAPTRFLKRQLNSENGLINADLAQDIAKIALVERHHGTGSITRGLVHGFGFTDLPSPLLPDSHHWWLEQALKIWRRRSTA